MGKSHILFPVCPLHLLWVSLLAPPLGPHPTHRYVSLISFILSLIHPFPSRVSTSLSLSLSLSHTHTHTHTHSQCTGLGLHPTHIPCETLWHTFPWVSMILSFSIPSSSFSSQCWQEQGLCPNCCSKVLGLLIIEPNEQHRIFKVGSYEDTGVSCETQWQNQSPVSKGL